MLDPSDTRPPAAQRANLPVVVGRVTAPQRHPAPTAGAEFVSQLIAERNHLPPQRERRRATLSVAVGSYDAATAQAVRRMPPGYRRTLIA